VATDLPNNSEGTTKAPSTPRTWGERATLVEYADLKKPMLKFTLVVIFWYLGESRVDCSYPALMRRMNMTRRQTVIDHVAELEAMGIVKKSGKTRADKGTDSNRYEIDFEALARCQMSREPRTEDRNHLAHQNEGPLAIIGAAQAEENGAPDPRAVNALGGVRSAYGGITPSVRGGVRSAHPFHGFKTHPPHPGINCASPNPLLTHDGGNGKEPPVGGVGQMGEDEQGKPTRAYDLLRTTGRYSDEAAGILHAAIHGAETKSIDVLTAAGFDMLEARRCATVYKRGRIIAVLKSIVRKLDKREPVASCTALMHTWLTTRSKPEHVTAEGAQLMQIRQMQRRRAGGAG
jgi:hypothetical protein